MENELERLRMETYMNRNKLKKMQMGLIVLSTLCIISIGAAAWFFLQSQQGGTKELSLYKSKVQALTAENEQMRTVLDSTKTEGVVSEGVMPYYMVQFGAYKNVELNDSFVSLELLNTEDPLKRLCLGGFGDYDSALKFLDVVKRKGFSDAFIRGVENGNLVNYLENQ